MSDLKILPGKGPTVDSLYLVTADQVTITGDGSNERPLVAHGGGAPTVEHVTASSNSVVLSPTKSESFVKPTIGAADPQTGTLANGSTDGFQKTVTYLGGGVGATLVVTPAAFADGTVVTLPRTGGSATFAWNATAVSWQLVSTYGGVVS